MRLLHLSDLHFGAIHSNLPDQLLHTVGKIQPDLVVISGDLTQRGIPTEFHEAKTFIDALPSPVLVVPGNHDMPHGHHLWTRFRHPWRLYRQIIHHETEPVWRGEQFIAAGLNSGRPGGWYLDWARGDISLKQVQHLRTIYGDSSTIGCRVLVVHHPPAAPPGGTKRHLLNDRRGLFTAMNATGVDLVLSGHFHMSYAVAMRLPGVEPRSCVLSVTSTATSYRLQGEPNGFHLLECTPQMITVERWILDGGDYAPRDRQSFIQEAARSWVTKK